MRRVTGRLTYANVVSTLCLFLVLAGGTAFAATQLPGNSVGTKQLKSGAVTAAKVKEHSLTGNQIDASTLATVPSAVHAGSADYASSAAQAAHATDSDTVEGHSASSFLASGATAADSKALGGLGPSSFVGAPIVVRGTTFGGYQSGSGRSIVSAHCDNGETAISGGFREAGTNAGQPGLGFDGTFRLLASGPAVLGEDFPAPADPGEIPTAWYIELHYGENAANPEVLVYVDCVPNR
jgi:hypothetical protein